jgi:phosphotransferase system  glucose/maltose/N-acetylglucosamine-specific IIC component
LYKNNVFVRIFFALGIGFSFLQSAGAAAFGSILWDMGGTLLRRELLPI